MPRWGCQGKPAEIVARPIVAEIVHHQERIEIGGVAEAEGAPQLDARALQRGTGLADALDGADGHCPGRISDEFGFRNTAVVSELELINSLIGRPCWRRIDIGGGRAYHRAVPVGGRGRSSPRPSADRVGRLRHGGGGGGERSGTFAPDSRAARKAATKASPAPVVSIGSTWGAWTRQRAPPAPPRILPRRA